MSVERTNQQEGCDSRWWDTMMGLGSEMMQISQNEGFLSSDASRVSDDSFLGY